MSTMLHALATGSLSAPAFIAVAEKSLRGMDQKLGYGGEDRLVLFYYESRGEEVIWRDTRSYGFATGAWSSFIAEVMPVADKYSANVGQAGLRHTHVLLMDRTDRKNYFAKKDEALKLLADFGKAKAVEETERPEEPASVVAVEIMRETITRLAHHIWENKGKPEGQYLDDWLQAEAKLKSVLRAAR